MMRDDKTLDEVVVFSRRKLISSDGATLTYNVQDDPASGSSTMIEMLRHVPMITVDSQDNIKVNGKTNFKIYINGKEDPMLSGDIKSVLKSMPAATIKKIEVITEPGAKYDAEGTGGIINIITNTKTSVEGYMANIHGAFSNQGLGGGLYATTKVNKVTASLQGTYFHSALNLYSDSEVRQEILSSQSERLQVSNVRQKQNPYEFANGSLNLSWEPDTLNLFNAGINLSNFSSSPYSEESVVTYDDRMNKTWSYDRNFVHDILSRTLSATASYQHTFGRQGHHLILSYIFDHGKRENESVTHTFDVDGVEIPAPWRSNNNNYNSNKHTLQIDYANPLNEHHLIEAGFKGTWRPEDGASLAGFGPENDAIATDESQSLRMKQFQDIMAAYLAYTGNYGKWYVNAGLRYEHTHTGIRYRLGGYEDFTSNFGDIVPNGAVTFKFTPASNIRLAYQMRINRPSLEELNPYRNTVTPGQVSYGNPDLKSNRSNSLSISYSNYGGVIGGSVQASYSRTDNAVYSYQFASADNLITTTYANIGHNQSFGLNANAQWNPSASLSVSVYGGTNYNHYYARSPRLTTSNHGWETYAGGDVNYTFPFKMRLSVNGGYGSPSVGLQSDGGSSWYYYGIGLSREFLKDNRLGVQLYAGSFLPSSRTYQSVVVNDDLRISSSTRYSTWTVGLGISYRLGSLQAHVRTTGADLDIEQASGSTTTGLGPKR